METIITDKYIIHINRPVLTDAERAAKMENIRKAAVRLVQADLRAAGSRG